MRDELFQCAAVQMEGNVFVAVHWWIQVPIALLVGQRSGV